MHNWIVGVGLGRVKGDPDLPRSIDTGTRQGRSSKEINLDRPYFWIKPDGPGL